MLFLLGIGLYAQAAVNPAFREFLDSSYRSITTSTYHDTSMANRTLIVLDTWDYQLLGPSDQLDYQAYQALLKTWSQDPAQPALQIPYWLPTPLWDSVKYKLMNQLSLKDGAAVKNWILQFQGFPQAIDAGLAELQKQTRRQAGLPRMVLAQMASGLDAYYHVPPWASELVLFFQRQIKQAGDLSPEQAAQAMEKVVTIMERDIYPAYRRLKTGLEALAATAPQNYTLCSGPQGPASYQSLIAQYGASSLDAAALNRQAQTDMAEISAELDRLLPGEGLPYLKGVNFMKTEATSSADDIPWAMEQIKLTREMMQRWTSLPLPDFEVRFGTSDPVPNYKGAWWSDSDQAHLNLSTNSVHQGSGGLSVIWHEGFPGHALQLGIQAANEQLPLFRRFAELPVFVEGWAFYAQNAMANTTLGNNPYYQVSCLLSRYGLAAQVAVDTGINGLGWTYQEAQSFLMKNKKVDSQHFGDTINRVIYWPGQSLSYYCGYRWITDLRQELEKRDGAAFDLRAFHDRLLSCGYLPLDLLRTQVLGSSPR